MDNTTSSIADYYQEKAREIGRLASRSRSADVRLQLFEIAELFRRMAAHVARRMSSENTGRNLDRATAPSHPPVPMKREEINENPRCDEAGHKGGDPR